jgi:hypothetical protein
MDDAELPHFRSAEWVTITGVGRIAAITADQLPDDLLTARPLLGQLVVIDDDIYRVTGVEGCLVNHGPGHRCDRPFGLRVRAEGAEA